MELINKNLNNIEKIGEVGNQAMESISNNLDNIYDEIIKSILPDSIENKFIELRDIPVYQAEINLRKRHVGKPAVVENDKILAERNVLIQRTDDEMVGPRNPDGVLQHTERQHIENSVERHNPELFLLFKHIYHRLHEFSFYCRNTILSEIRSGRAGISFTSG